MGLSSVLPGIVLLGIVIFFHELGHFLAAKWRGVTVLRFSLGMGPELVGFTHGGTRYCVSWIPLGGFVQMAGDHLADDGSMPEGGPEQFLTHPWWGRIIIAVAGPAANLVTAFLVVLLMFMVGVHLPDWPNHLGALQDDTHAYAAGLREGDVITSIGGRKVGNWHELEEAASHLDGKSAVTFAFVRDSSADRVVVAGKDTKAVLADFQPPPTPPIVGNVGTGTPAYRAGMKEGDRVLAVDGKPMHAFGDIPQALRGKADHPVTFRLERDGKAFDLAVTPMSMDGKCCSAQIGIGAVRGVQWVQRLSFIDAVPAALRTIPGLVGGVYSSLWLTLTRPFYYREAIGGPIFIAQMAAESARMGLDSWLYLLALINVAIMAFNLLPLPLLDGGHITLAVLEGARRRAVSGRTYMNFQKVGLVLVGTLFVFILSKDLVRPFQRLRAVEQAPRETTTVAPDQR